MSSFEVLSPALSSDFPEQWSELVGQDHFWMQWRLKASVSQLRSLGVSLDAPWHGLEIGCARGVVQTQLGGVSNWRIDGCDLSQASLEANRSSTGRKLLYDIHDRRGELEEAYDFLVLFDVIEHVADPRAFLESALFHLKPGGLVLVNVPALQPLASSYDRAVGHLRRYTRRSLESELQEGGLEVRDVRYWGFSMVPLLILRKMLTSFEKDPEKIIDRGMRERGGLVGRALRALMRFETKLLRRPFLGTSVLALGVKRG